jgi:hypothetical protein
MDVDDLRGSLAADVLTPASAQYDSASLLRPRW